MTPSPRALVTQWRKEAEDERIADLEKQMCVALAAELEQSLDAQEAGLRALEQEMRAFCDNKSVGVSKVWWNVTLQTVDKWADRLAVLRGEP